MKRLILVLCILGWIGNVAAQSPLDQRLSLRINNQSLESVLYQLIEDHQAPISFRNDQIPSKLIIANFQRTPLREILDQLLVDTDLEYQLIGQQILIAKGPDLPTEVQFTISGFIADEDTGERLIGASIYDAITRRGVVSNEYGFFSLTLPAGPVQIRASYLGYQAWESLINLTEDVVLQLSLDGVVTLNEVIVYARNDSLTDPIGGLSTGEAIGLRETVLLPSLAGESDIIRTAQLLPGVHTGTDGAEGLQVRGGDAGQNLVLIDGVPVYNVGHGIGIFSVFNTSTIRSAQLLRGGFPARYGGRLSGIIDVRTKEGNLQSYHGSAEAGLLTSRFSIEGPIQKDRSSFFVGGRWSFVHWFLQPQSERFKRNRGEEGVTDYRFYDINAKVNHIFSERDRIYLSFYRGDDVYEDLTEQERFLQVEKIDGTVFDYVVDQFYQESIKWGNTVGAFRWNHIFNEKLFSNFSLTYSRLAVVANYAQRDSLIELNSGVQINDINEGLYQTGISDVGMRMDLHYLPKPRREWRLGFGSNRRIFEPGVLENNNTLPEDSLANARIPTTEMYAYLEGQGEWGDYWRWNAGAHATWWRVRGQNYQSIQPRVSISFTLSPRFSLNASVSHMVQYLHLLSNTTIGLPTDLWVPSTDQVRPSSLWMGTLGGRWRWNDEYELSLAGYYKKMNNLLAFADGADSLFNWEAGVTQGVGEAYGSELMLSKTKGRFTGWLAYTLAWSQRQFDDINFGEVYPFKYDRRHDLKAAVVCRISPRWHFSANWIYSSGFAFTVPLVKYRVAFPGQTIANIEIEDPLGRNNNRMPAYHRLDINMHFEWGQESRWQHALNIGVYNIYNRQNPLYYDVRRIYRERENQLVTDRQFVQVLLAPLLPTFSYKLSF